MDILEVIKIMPYHTERVHAATMHCRHNARHTIKGPLFCAIEFRLLTKNRERMAWRWDVFKIETKERMKPAATLSELCDLEERLDILDVQLENHIEDTGLFPLSLAKKRDRVNARINKTYLEGFMK